MASLLLIGGTGFFGKSFLDSFSRGCLSDWKIDKVIAMSRHADQLRIVAPHLLNGRVELINADIGTVGSLPVADYVIHAAASTDARNYLSKAEKERRNIQAGVYNYCRLAPVFHGHSKIVYVSSGAVYGVQPPDTLFLEEDSLSLNLEEMPDQKRDYAIAKRDAEHAIMLLCEQFQLRATIARCFAFVGPWLPRDQHFAIGNFINDGLHGMPIKLHATHQVYRSYMHADDLVQWLMTMCENATADCEIYNVGSDAAVSLVDLVGMISKVFKVSVESNKIEKQFIDRYIPSIEKAKAKLGLKIEINLDAAINKTIKSIMGHRLI